MQALAMPASRYIFGTLPWYSVTMVSAIVVAILLALREEKRRGLPKDTVIDLALWLIPCGIVGARLYYVAFTWDLFRSRPLAILEIWKGGLAIYGALIAGVLAALVFSRRRKLSLLTLVDMVVPGLALAQCIGRWGNYFNMEAYGLPITNPAWQFFPAGVLIPENGQPVWHMATFFYESLWDLGVFIALQSLRKHCRRPGDLTCWYVVLYGAGTADCGRVAHGQPDGGGRFRPDFPAGQRSRLPGGVCAAVRVRPAPGTQERMAYRPGCWVSRRRYWPGLRPARGGLLRLSPGFLPEGRTHAGRLCCTGRLQPFPQGGNLPAGASGAVCGDCVLSALERQRRFSRAFHSSLRPVQPVRHRRLRGGLSLFHALPATPAEKAPAT